MGNNAITEWSEREIIVSVGCDIATIFLGNADTGTRCGLSTGSDGGFDVTIQNSRASDPDGKEYAEIVFRGKQDLLEYDCGDKVACRLEPVDGGNYEPFGYFRAYEQDTTRYYDEDDDGYWDDCDRKFVITLYGKWKITDPTGEHAPIEFE